MNKIAPLPRSSQYSTALTKLRRLLATAALIALSCESAHAANYTWNGTGNTNATTGWSTTTDWTATGLPGATDTITFSSTSPSSTVTLGGNQSIGSISIGSGATGATTLTSGGVTATLTIGAGGITDAVSTGTVTLGSTTSANNFAVNIGANETWSNASASPMQVYSSINGTAATSATQTLTTSGAGSITLGGAIGNGSGGGALGITTGAGTLILSGTNTYSGATTTGTGTLQLNGASSLSANTAITMASGGTIALRSDSSATFTPSSVSTTFATGTINFDVNQIATGSSNTLTLGVVLTPATNSSITINATGGNGDTLAFGGINTGSSSGSAVNHVLTINAITANVITGNITTGSFGTTLDFDGSGTITVASITENSNSGNVVNFGNGSDAPTVTLAGATASSGGRSGGNLSFTLNSGTLNLNNAGALNDPGGSSAPFTINGGTIDNTSGAAITVSPGSTTINGNFTYGGTGDLTLANGVTFGTATSITASGSKTLTFNSAITFAGQSVGLASGSTGNVAFSGGLTINNADSFSNAGTGTLNLGALSVSSNQGSVDFSGTGPIVTTTGNASGISSLIMGIAYSFNNGADFATVNGSGVVVAANSLHTEVALPATGASSSTLYFLTGSQTLTASETGAALRINDTSTTDTLNIGSNTLTLGGSGVSGILYNGGANGSYTISGTGYVTAGTGHSMNINTYSGTLTINAPVLDGAGNTFDVLNKEGNGTLILDGTNAYGASAGASSGGTNVGAGTLDLGNGNTGAFTGSATINIQSGATLGIGLANGSTITSNLNDPGNIVGIESAGVTNTLTGVINSASLSSSGGFTQNGLGTTVLAGSNFYTGATLINAGAIEVTNAGGLGQAVHNTSSITVASGAALQLAGGFTTLGAYTVNLNGAGRTASPNGALENISGANTYTGSIVLASASTIGADSGTLSLTGTVTGGGNALTLVGAGNQSYSGPATNLAGITDNSTGAVAFSGNLSGTTGSIAINSGAAAFTGNIAGTNALTVNNATSTVTLSGSNTYSGGTSVTAGTVLLSNTSGSATGTTTLAVSGSSTLGGTGKSSGTSFSISGTGTATGSRATVLVGKNSAGDTSTTGVLSLIASATSTITNANLSFNISASTAGALNGNPAGSGTELNVVATKVSFGTAVGAVTLTLNVQNEPGIIAAYTPYVLIAGSLASGGGGANGSQYTGLSLGSTLLSSGSVTETLITGSNLQLAFGSTLDQSYYGTHSYLVLYQDTANNIDDIDVVVVPEPGTWALMFGGLVTLIVWQRRKRS